MFTSQISTPSFEEAFAKMAVSIEFKISTMLAMLGAEVVAYLRSMTGEMRPPAHAGEGERAAHPGHWADVTGALSLAYGYRVDTTADGFVLVLFNTMDYAIYLELKEGYFVLHGVTEPGGPVEKALEHAIAAIAPEWRIVNISFRPF